MLVVETFLKYTPECGLGLFSSEFIKKDSIYWIRNVQFDTILTPFMMKGLNEISFKYVEKYGFLENTLNWYLCSDNAKYSNHSFNPNTYDTFNENGLLIESRALIDIYAGEEILCDYTKICLSCKQGINF